MSSPCSHSHRATGSFPYNLFTSSSIKGFGPLNSYPTENCDAFSSNANFISFLTTWRTGSEVKFSHANRCWGESSWKLTNKLTFLCRCSSTFDALVNQLLLVDGSNPLWCCWFFFRSWKFKEYPTQQKHGSMIHHDHKSV